MSKSDGPKLSLKVAINKQKSKVVFAEANSHFVDVLLSFLTLPLGKITKILNDGYGKEAATVGSLTSLYRSLTNVDSSHFHVAGAKQMLLDPRSWSETAFPRLKLDVTRSERIGYFVCEELGCWEREWRNISMYSDIAKCRCGRRLNRMIYSGDDCNADENGGVFMINDLSFIIFDDLRVVPVTPKFLETLCSFGITDAQESELSDFSVGIDDIIKLLELSLTSSTPLTDLIVKKTQSCSIPIKHEPVESGVSDSRKITIQISIQKSTNKFLFAQVEDDFLEILFSFLVLPLGGLEHLLGGKTSFPAIDNLYRSVTEIADQYFLSSSTRNCLTNPKLAYGFGFKYGLLPLVEDSPPQLYSGKFWSWMRNQFSYGDRDRYHSKIPDSLHKYHSYDPFTFCNGPERFVKEKKIFVVCDDLTTAPYGVASVVSILGSLRVPFSDVSGIELHMGFEEALSILKASLTSTTVFTDALITPILSKQPKQEPQV